MSEPNFALESYPKQAGKVAGARPAGHSHFSGLFLRRSQSEIRPRRATFPIDFALNQFYSCLAITAVGLSDGQALRGLLKSA